MPQPTERTEEEEKRRDPCGTPRLPLTVVSYVPGPLGQGGTVRAEPLTRCPGNTVGSFATRAVYPLQFACIYAKGLSRRWIPAHLLHGRTRRTAREAGDRNLHGPGDDRRNIIIADSKLNGQMSAQAEQLALIRVHDLNQVLWYEAAVTEYFPGAELFARQITVTYGLYNPLTRTKLPPLDMTPLNFRSEESAPPTCPTTLGAAAPAAAEAAEGTRRLFDSTIDICLRELDSQEFSVDDGGLSVTVYADWVPTPAAPPNSAPPSQDYEVSLTERDVFDDDEIDTLTVPVGESFTLSWTELEEDDDYFLTFSVPNHDRTWCLRGEVSVATFHAPRVHYSMQEPELA